MNKKTNKQPGKNARASPMIREVTEGMTITLHEAADDGTLGTVTGILARGNTINRNMRYYSADVLAAAAEAATDALAEGEVTGLLNHPDWYEGMRGSPDKIALRWDELTMDGSDLTGKGVIVGTTVGQEIAALRKAKVKLGLSTNGTGTQRFIPAKEVDPDHHDPDELIAVIEDFRLLTIDLVNDPASVGAQLNQEALARLAEATRETLKEKTMTPEELAKLLSENPELRTSVQAAALAEATAEQLKSANAGLFAEVQALTPKPAQEAAGEDKGLLDRLVAVEAENKRLIESHKRTERQAIAREMLHAAELPAMGKSGDIDLDARFSAQLEAAAMNAETAETARTAVTGLIEERRALIGATGPAYRPGGNPGIPRRESTAQPASSPISDMRADLGLN